MKNLLLALGALCAFVLHATVSAQPYEMQLDAVSPGSGPGGTEVRLTGRNFGASQAGHRVILRHNSAVMRYMTVRSWSDTQIVAVVPADAMSGPSTIAILNPPGETGMVNASRHVPFSVMPTLKPGVAQNIKPGFAQTPGVTVKPKVTINQLGCKVDPAVQPLRVVHARRAANGTILFYLVAPIKNLGTETFSAGAGEAGYTLRMGTRVLKRQNFTRIPAGGTIDAGMNIEGWRLSDEFPPDFTLEINYGPDNFVDANPHNDDCRLQNNKATLSGAEVMRVLRAAFP